MGLGVTEIKEKMAEEGISVFKGYAIQHFKQMEETVANLPPLPRPRKGATNEILDFIYSK